MNLNKYLTCFLLILTFTINGQTIKLKYIPKNQVVKFNFINLTLYTDTTSIFSLHNYSPYISYEYQYKDRIKKLIYCNNKKDTITFTGSFIPFNDSIQIKYENDWRVWLTIRQLIIENKVIVIDSKGKIVNKIKIKKKGSKDKCYIGKVFINKKTKEELFIYKKSYVCLGLLWEY